MCGQALSAASDNHMLFLPLGDAGPSVCRLVSGKSSCL